MTELFHSEAVRHATRRLEGEVLLATPPPMPEAMLSKSDAAGTVTLIGKFAGQVNPATQRFTLRLSLGAMSA